MNSRAGAGASHRLLEMVDLPWQSARSQEDETSRAPADPLADDRLCLAWQVHRACLETRLVAGHAHHSDDDTIEVAVGHRQQPNLLRAAAGQP